MADFVKRWQTQLYGKRKLAPKIPSHTFTDEDKERQKQQILTWHLQAEDGFIVVKRDFLPTKDETWEDYKKIMKARGFRAMSYHAAWALL